MRKRIKIGTRWVGDGEPVFIIAEAGVNHNGSLALAKKLIDAAKTAGADAIKFQTFRAQDVVTSTVRQTTYQTRNTGKAQSQLALLKKLELSARDHKVLQAYAKRCGIIFLSAPHGGFRSVDVLKHLHVPAYKLGSGDLTNHPLVAYVAKVGKPLIISTGMGAMREVQDAVSVARKAGNTNVIVLQCTTEYPSHPEEANLRVIPAMRKATGALVGYSDHTVSTTAAIAAVALGACVIEKHLTLDTRMSGPDHRASADPRTFASYVAQVRAAEQALGSAEKKTSPRERANIPLVRKSLVAERPIQKGERFTESNLTIKRPGTGLLPRFYPAVLGKKARRDIPAGALIREGDY